MTTTAPAPTEATPGSQHSRSPVGWLVDLLLITACALVAALLEQDANWDQLQYHYWYPWQLFNGGFTDPDLYGGRFQNPLAQVPFFVVVSTLPPVWAQATLGALAGASAVLVRRIAARVLPYTGGWLLAASTATAALGLVGAGFRSEWGTSYADVLLAGLLLGGLLLVLRGRPLAAGMLAGAAVGLKYTSAPFAIAALVALMVLPGSRLARSARWLLGAGLGWLATGAWWAWHLWRTYDSPVFPFWNGIFASRWYPAENLTDDRYGVSGLQGWLLWPWHMATGSARALDLPVRDARWLLLLIALLAIATAIRRMTAAGWAVVAFTVTGALMWLAIFGVLRYAIPAEMLVAVLLALAISLHFGPRSSLAAIVGLALVLALLTQSAASRRVPSGDTWFTVSEGAFSRVTAGDVVLVDGEYPSTFLLPDHLPSGVPVHVVQKDFTGTALTEWLRSDLAGAAQIWVVTDRGSSQVDAVIGDVDESSCTKIESNVVDRWLCPVTL